jgi:hypothetical protein
MRRTDGNIVLSKDKEGVLNEDVTVGGEDIQYQDQKWR